MVQFLTNYLVSLLDGSEHEALFTSVYTLTSPHCV